MKRRGLAFFSLSACGGAGLLAALLLAASSAAGADTGTTTGPPPTDPPVPTTTIGTTTIGTTTAPPPPTTTTTTGTTTTTPTPPRPNTIPAGVTIADVLVGGLSPVEATAVVRRFFLRPLILRNGKTRLAVTPRALGASAYLGDAVKRARVARPGSNVRLKVELQPARVARYVQTLARRFDRASVDAKLTLKGAKPFVSKERAGRSLDQPAAVRALTADLGSHLRTPISLAFSTVAPKVSRKTIGDVIVIRRGANRLAFYDGMKLRREFGVATGQARYPTPLGTFRIVVKWRNPWWYPPASDWAKDEKPVPPGPGNPLGTRWMGISSPAVGIHGTPDAASIGYSVSHGCIRMLIPEVEWLFERVEVGTPVYIVR